MEILIKLKNASVLHFLEQLEKMKLIKLLKPKKKTGAHSLADELAGSVPAGIAKKLNAQLDQSRNEWNTRAAS